MPCSVFSIHYYFDCFSFLQYELNIQVKTKFAFCRWINFWILSQFGGNYYENFLTWHSWLPVMKHLYTKGSHVHSDLDQEFFHIYHFIFNPMSLKLSLSRCFLPAKKCRNRWCHCRVHRCIQYSFFTSQLIFSFQWLNHKT